MFGKHMVNSGYQFDYVVVTREGEIMYIHVIARVPLERYFSYYVVCCVHQLLLILKAHLWLSNA